MDGYLVTCPFDPLHKVKSTRLQTHIVKCEKNHPGYQVCPFNATHRILPPAYKDHVQKCPSREAFFPQKLPPKVVARLAKPSACVPIIPKLYTSEKVPANHKGGSHDVANHNGAHHNNAINYGLSSDSTSHDVVSCNGVSNSSRSFNSSVYIYTSYNTASCDGVDDDDEWDD